MAGLPERLGPKYEVQGNPCGCMVINTGRVAICQPCGQHVGKMQVVMYPSDKPELLINKKDQPIAGTGPQI